MNKNWIFKIQFFFMYTYVVLLFWKSSRTSSIKKSSNGTNYFVIGSNKENSFKLSVKQTPGTASDEVTWSSNQESKENESVQAKYSLYILPEMSLSTSDSIEFTLPEDGTLLKENDKYFKVKPDQYET